MRARICSTAVSIACAGALALGAALPAAAQQYPAKPVTLISLGAPGGGFDFMLRAFLPELATRWKNTPLIDYRPGAAGLVAALTLARAEPDGYTMMLHTDSLYVYNNFNKTAPDAEKQFIPVTVVANQVNACIAHPSTGIKSMAEFVALTKANPGKLNIASFTSSLSELMMRRLVSVTGMQATIIPSYNTTANQVRAVLSNETQFSCVSPAGIVEQVKAGQLVPLATTGRERSSVLPDTPTMRSLGYDYLWEQWYAIFVPVGTPRDIIAKLKQDFSEATRTPGVSAQLRKAGYDPETRAPDETVAGINEAVKIYKALAKEHGVKPQ